MSTSATKAGVVPPSELVALARAYVDAHGVGSAAREWELSRTALTQFLAGLRVHRGTVALIARALQWHAPSAPPSHAA